MKKISIITACLNPTSFELLRSLRNNSSRGGIEWIVIDGGTDEVAYPVLRQIKQQCDVFAVEQGSSIYEALNVGFDYVTTCWVWIMGLDDSIASGAAIERLVNYLGALEADVYWCVGGINQISWRTERCRVFTPRANLTQMPRQFSGVMAISHQAILARSNIVGDLYRFDTRFKIAADYHLVLRLMQSFSKVSPFTEVVAVVGSNGISNKPQNAFLVFWEYYLIRREILRKNYPSRYWIKNFLKVLVRASVQTFVAFCKR